MCPVEVLPPYYEKPPFKFDLKKDRDKKPTLSARNVNRYIEIARKSDATHMWMLDADCEPPPNALHELLKLDVDIASGITFCHKDIWRTTAGRWYPPATPQHKWSTPIFKWFEINQIYGKIMRSPPEIATGAFCLLCRRRVLEPFHPKFNPLRFRWDPPQEHGIDLTYWKDAQMFGFSTAINGNVLCGHLPEHPLTKLVNKPWK